MFHLLKFHRLNVPMSLDVFVLVTFFRLLSPIHRYEACSFVECVEIRVNTRVTANKRAKRVNPPALPVTWDSLPPQVLGQDGYVDSPHVFLNSAYLCPQNRSQQELPGKEGRIEEVPHRWSQIGIEQLYSYQEMSRHQVSFANLKDLLRPSCSQTKQTKKHVVDEILDQLFRIVSQLASDR